MSTAKQKLKFRKWIEDAGGIKVVADSLGVTEHTVRVWVRGEGNPEVKMIIDIIAYSKGTKNELDFDTIYKECTRNK